MAITKRNNIEDTQRSGETQTRAVHASINAGKRSIVIVRPQFSITKPVPKRENAKEIEFVTWNNLSRIPKPKKDSPGQSAP